MNISKRPYVVMINLGFLLMLGLCSCSRASTETINSAASEVEAREIAFAKKPDAKYFDPAYLARYVGDYSLQDVVVSIGLQGETLTLRQPGRPLEELVPVLGDEFAIRQAKVVTLKFLLDGKGSVTAVEVRQPGGIYTLEKIEE